MEAAAPALHTQELNRVTQYAWQTFAVLDKDCSKMDDVLLAPRTPRSHGMEEAAQQRAAVVDR